MDEIRAALRELIRRLKIIDDRLSRVEERVDAAERSHKNRSQWLNPWRVIVTASIIGLLASSILFVFRAQYRGGAWEMEIRTAELAILLPAIATAAVGLIPLLKFFNKK